MKLPIEYNVIISPFQDPRRNNHPGVDLGVKSGTPIKSPENGIVIDSKIRQDACGGTLFIDHQNGFKSRYCHLKEIKVNQGDKVTSGQVVGFTGGASNDIGKVNSTGAHLHLELYKDGGLVNPMDYLSGNFEDTKNELITFTITKKIIDALIDLMEKRGRLFF